MLKLLLVGHRGVGKTRLVEVLKKHNSSLLFFSLDQWIEESQGQSIKTLFEQKGENLFREIEIKVFNELVSTYRDQSLVIDVGAGFLGEVPSGYKVLWLERSVDLSKSQFLNRPNLDGQIRISSERFDQRQKRYSQISDLQLELPESLSEDHESLDPVFKSIYRNDGTLNLKTTWFMTVLHAKMISSLSDLKRIQGLQFEWRDDLLESTLIEKGIKQFPDSLLSFRDHSLFKNHQKWIDHHTLWDWPLEWGFNSEAPILSLHQRKSNMAETLKSLPSTEQILKLAIPIENFQELSEAHQWFIENPTRRSFLPMSREGRWSWYRLLTSKISPLKFLRLGKGSSSDQPTLFETLYYEPSFQSFAAILGSPIKHSLTPSLHRSFFKNKKANIFRIQITEEEFEVGIDVLENLGLCYAAITSPLKQRAAEWLGDPSLSSLNTLKEINQSWKGTNTDGDGLKPYQQLLISKNVVVWGGGGTHGALKTFWSQLPHGDTQNFQLSFYSSQSGELKEGVAQHNPDVVIWAVGADAFSNKGVFPPIEWAPKAILDLNYTQDSYGIECAQIYGCQYHSGLAMFLAQGLKQQEFWS